MFRTSHLSIIRSSLLYTQQWYMSYKFAGSLQAGSGLQNCPKHVEFYSKNKFEKLLHLVGFIIRIYLDPRSPERQMHTSNIYRCADSLRAVSKPVWHIPHCCVYSEKTPDDGQRNCPKYVEFYSKNKFEKLVHLVGFNIWIYHDARSPERQIFINS